MKIFFMRMKIFFSLQSTKTFLRVFAISFPIVLGLTYFLVLRLVDIVDERDMQDVFSSFSEIVDMERKSNKHIIIDFSEPEQRKVSNNSNPHFWEGNALEYRYMMPKHGIPSSTNDKE